MSTDVKIEMVSSADTSLYSRSATSKLISSDNAPSSPPLTTKVLQIASGRRKGFEAKNDPDGEKRSERRVASRVPKFEDGELKVETQKFSAISTDADNPVTESAKSEPRANGSHIHRNDAKPTDPVETPLSPKLRSEYGSNLIELNVSPLPTRKETSSPPPPNPLNPLPVNPPVITNLSSSTRKKEESPPSPKEEKPKETQVKKESGRRAAPKSETSGRRRSPSPVIEEVREGSPPAGRRVSLTRSPPTSIKTRTDATKQTSQPRSRTTESKDHKEEKRVQEKAKSDERRRPDKDNRVNSKGRIRDDVSTPVNPQTIPANIHYDYKSVISQPEIHGPDRHSNRRAKSAISKSDERRPTSRDSKPKTRTKKSRSPTPPRKPHDDRPSIRLGGRQATSREMFDSSGSISSMSAPSSSSHQSESSTTETTSRRKIKTRSEALDKKLKDTFAEDEFSPEDDSHLKFAIHAALEESRAKSIQEAIDAGHELNAEVLKSLTRPNAIEEVIETMVSQRRDKMREKRESDRREAKSPQVKKRVKTVKSPIDEEIDKPVAQKTKKAVLTSPTKKPSTPTVKKVVQVVDDDLDDEAEEDNRAPPRRVKTKTGTKLVRKKAVAAKTVLIEDEADGDQAEEDSDEPLIETIEEVQSPVKVAKPVTETIEIAKAAPKAKSKIQVDDGTPKTELPGTPLLIPTLLKNEQTEEVEVIGSTKETKSKGGSTGGVAVKTFHINEKGDADYMVEEPVRVPRQPKVEEDGEVNIKLPRENRKARKSDYLEKADELGNRDYVYDPLGVDQPFGDEDDSVGDDIYEESSEDDSKLTIAEKKDEMLYRFKLIKEGYPGIALPRITKKMKLAKMVRLYEHVMSRIKLKVKTNNFKIFLVIGFLAMQFAAKKFGADAAGFTINQMTSMKHYEKYLREIGESDFSSFGSDLPVMVRLPFFMAVNMGIFLIAKWIFKKTGKDYTTQFHKLYAQLTGGDDYVYIKEEGGTAGLDAGGGGESDGGGGGIFGMIKSFLGMMGGGDGGGGGEEKPKRGEAAGPTYKRRRKPAAE